MQQEQETVKDITADIDVYKEGGKASAIHRLIMHETNAGDATKKRSSLISHCLRNLDSRYL